MSAGFFHFAAADAGRADLHSLVRAVVIDSDGLDVGFEDARGDFHHVHADTAFFLCKTPTDDSAAVELLFSTDFANIAHYDTSYALRIEFACSTSCSCRIRESGNINITLFRGVSRFAIFFFQNIHYVFMWNGKRLSFMKPSLSDGMMRAEADGAGGLPPAQCGKIGELSY